MIALGRRLKNTPQFEQMLHLLCSAHALNNVADVIRTEYTVLDAVIMSVKKIFKKSHARVQIFKNEAPGIRLPPSPCVTRWGKWIECSKYYNDDRNRTGLFNALKAIQNKESANPPILQEMIQFIESEALKIEAQSVYTHYYKICEVIANIETDAYDTKKFLAEIADLDKSMEHTDIPYAVWNKFQEVFERNEGYKEIKRYFDGMKPFPSLPRMYVSIFIN